MNPEAVAAAEAVASKTTRGAVDKAADSLLSRHDRKTWSRRTRYDLAKTAIDERFAATLRVARIKFQWQLHKKKLRLARAEAKTNGPNKLG